MNKNILKLIIFTIMFFCIPLNIFAYTGTIKGTSVQLRKGPGTGNQSLYSVSSGTIITIDDLTLHSGTGCSAGWYKGTYNGTTVYVCSTYVTISTSTTSSNGIVNSGIVIADWSARINANNVSARKEPSTSASVVNTLSLGTNVTVLSSTTKKNSGCTGNLWYQIKYYNNKTAYVCAKYVTYKTNITASDEEYAQTLREAGFNDTYIPYLTYLHQKHPNWIFTAKTPKDNFGTAVSKQASYNYMQTTNNYYRTSTTPAEGKSWYRVNQGVIAFYMDPRNWLTEERIFMFAKQDFDNNFDSQYPSMIKSIFGTGTLSDDMYTIPIYNASKQYGISPTFVASRIRLEVGANGSDSTNGTSFTYEGQTYSGYYNFFNIGAYEKTVNGTKYSAIVMGLVTAKNKGWNTIEKAIAGGVKFLADGYVNAGQGTGYYQKFNVNPNTQTSFPHQYMTNIQAPATEANQTYNSYKGASLLNQQIIFEIPVYKNMPLYTSLPLSLDEDNYLSALSVEEYTLDFNMNTQNYELNVEKDKTSVTVNATARSSKATVAGTGEIALSQTSTTVNIVVTSEIGVTRTYKLVIKKSIDTTTPDEPTTPPNEDPNGNGESGNGDNGQNNDSGNDNTLTPANEIITSAGYTTNNNYINNITLGSSVQAVISKLNNDTVTITDSSNKPKTSGKIATGDKITINDTTYTVVINGDVDGDGDLSAVDYVKIKNHIMGTTKLSGAYQSAADYDNDIEITAVDYVKIKNYIMKG